MYQLYKKETRDHLSYFIFSETFDKEFNLHFHQPILDSYKKCDLFNVKIKAANDVAKTQLEIKKELQC